jgi:methionine synthase I (cobalamin-dependent)
MAGYIPELLDSGADIIGGCCGTGVEHIRAYRGTVDKGMVI